PLGIYIADFYCHKLKLVIELDGSIHQLTDIKEQDQQRQNDLERNGYTVIRFTNKQVMKQASDVMANIQLIVEKLTEQDALTNTLNKPPSGGLGVL
ncbi:MAG TPA: endonuclease domain-containing protein, partial [Flavisolibacter sp.]